MALKIRAGATNRPQNSRDSALDSASETRQNKDIQKQLTTHCLKKVIQPHKQTADRRGEAQLSFLFLRSKGQKALRGIPITLINQNQLGEEILK